MSQFDTPEWHAAVAAVIEADSGEGIAGHLIDAISQVVAHDGTCLLAFHRSARPEVMHHTLEPAGARHYVERYLAGDPGQRIEPVSSALPWVPPEEDVTNAK